ncbi:uncharacterized protein LOC142328427 [Lycorma delicatula]|uniref:uncharacterized protein LOC142328427 n=1 Tax=Lycorma delicatula TaxID=130591 RepID=UPI003F5132A4
MPWQQREIIQFCLLLLCVPVQYYISGYFTNVKDRERSQIVINTMKGIGEIKDNLLSSNFWTLKWQELMVWMFADILGNDNDKDDETTEESTEDGKFPKDFDLPSRLTRVHKERPSDLLFRVGQVVQFHTYSYIGVIIGWEYENEDTGQPVYTVLIDETFLKDGLLSLTIEVEQNKFYVIRDHEVRNRNLKWYFASYDGSQYISRQWLKKIYPKD